MFRLPYIANLLRPLAKARVYCTALAVSVTLLAVAFTLTASAQVVGTPTLGVARQGHTATLLADGRILLIGGENASGPVSQAEIFDPATASFSVAATSLAARTDHTATLLADGRVLVTGGRHNDTILTSTEVFDPATNLFVAGPAGLQHARTGHSATVLADGKLLIVGGDAAGSAELFDPTTQQFTALTDLLGLPRMFHAAVRLPNGLVLIVGGVGPDNNPLYSGELFDPATQHFTTVGTSLHSARVLPTLRVLTDGKVQVLGGTQDNSMEIFDPAVGAFGAYAQLLPSSTKVAVATVLYAQTRAALFHNLQDGALVGAFAPLLDREEHSLTEIPAHNQALVAGGTDTSDQTLQSAAVLSSSSASITTDKIDYPPGDTVTISGKGWQPGEKVEMVLHEEPTQKEEKLSAIADATGSFANT